MKMDRRLAPRKQSWAARFTPEICHAWSLLQIELKEKGDSADARRLIEDLRTELGIRPGSPLPAARLHQATWPTRSTRPEMVNLPGPSSALRKSGVLATAAQVVEQPVQPKHAPAPSRAVLSDAELVEMHREAQRALSIGVTAYSLDRQITLERELVRACDLDCFDADAISYMLDQIHQMAFPDPTRPPRLVIEAAGDPRE